jgi:hypothetical protein
MMRPDEMPLTTYVTMRPPDAMADVTTDIYTCMQSDTCAYWHLSQESNGLNPVIANNLARNDGIDICHRTLNILPFNSSSSCNPNT